MGDISGAEKLIKQVIEAPELTSNHLLYAVVSEFHQLNNNTHEAINSLKKAIDLAKTQAEIQMLNDRLLSLAGVGAT
jgi:predicted RNA polymerase sigma factor